MDDSQLHHLVHRNSQQLDAVQGHLVEQEHRIFQVLRNYFVNRRHWKNGDSRVDASKAALLWALLRLITPASPVFGATVGIAALLVSLFSYYSLEDQNSLITSQRELEVHGMLIGRNARLLELMIEYPEQRAFFYDNADMSSISESDRQRALTLAELWTDVFEQVLIQLGNLPESMAPTWRQYAADMYATSPAIREYFSEANGWYVKELRELWLTGASAHNTPLQADRPSADR